MRQVDNLPAHVEEQSHYPDSEFDILELLIILAKHKKRIAGITVGTLFFAFVVSCFLPKMFSAKVTILPPQQSSSALSSVIGDLGGLAALAGKELNVKNPSELYANMLQSRTVEDGLIQRFDLRRVYNVRMMQDARKRLELRTDISTTKEGLIHVRVDDRDPSRAAEIANGYIDELHNLNLILAVTDAARRRLFFQQQLAAEKDELASAEQSLRLSEEKTGLIQLDAQGKSMIESVAKTRAQIAALEVQLQTMRSFATDENPEVVRSREELNALRGQLGKLENVATVGNGNILISTGKMPTIALEYIRRLRDLKYHETMVEFLAKQFEIAKIDEAKDSAIIQVVDKAVAPEKKSSPQRALIAVLAALVAFVATFAWAIAVERWNRKNRRDHDHARVQLLMTYLKEK